MSNPKATIHRTGHHVDAEFGKRTYFSGYEITGTCPICGAEVTEDLGKNAIYELVANQAFDYGLCCSNGDCMGEIHLVLVARVTLEVVS